MSNSAALSTIEGWIDSLKGVDKVLEQAAQDLAKDLKESIEKSVAAGESPNGDTWPKGKDGKAVLTNAANKVTITVSGSRIVASLGAPEAFHHFGTAKVPKRQILPTGSSLPPTLADAFRAGMIKKFSNAVRGSK